MLILSRAHGACPILPPYSLVPRPSCPALVACSTKSGGKAWHVTRAPADVTIGLLTFWFVLSPSLFFPQIQFVLSVQFALRVRLLLDWSWLATVQRRSDRVKRS